MPEAAPLSPRRVALAALVATGLLLALFRPGAVAPGPVVSDPSPGIRLLDDDSAWLDRARLADPALLVIPPVRMAPGGADGSMPEATPFPPIPPDLVASPEGTLRLPLVSLSPANPPVPDPLPKLDRPLETLGERVPRALPLARAPILRATSWDGQLVIERPIEDQEFIKYMSENDLGIKSLPILGLGIDAFGLQAPPVLLGGTGIPERDQALLQWAARQPWATWLPPGAYRVELGP